MKETIKKISRRDFLRITTLAAGSILATACTQPTPQVITQREEVPEEEPPTSKAEEEKIPVASRPPTPPPEVINASDYNAFQAEFVTDEMAVELQSYPGTETIIQELYDTKQYSPSRLRAAVAEGAVPASVLDRVWKLSRTSLVNEILAVVDFSKLTPQEEAFVRGFFEGYAEATVKFLSSQLELVASGQMDISYGEQFPGGWPEVKRLVKEGKIPEGALERARRMCKQMGQQCNHCPFKESYPCPEGTPVHDVDYILDSGDIFISSASILETFPLAEQAQPIPYMHPAPGEVRPTAADRAFFENYQKVIQEITHRMLNRTIECAPEIIGVITVLGVVIFVLAIPGVREVALIGAAGTAVACGTLSLINYEQLFKTPQFNNQLETIRNSRGQE